MGGTQVHCHTLAETAVKKGHSVIVLTTRHPKGVEVEQRQGYSIYYLPDTTPGRLNSAWWRQSLSKIIEINKKDKIDIIWAENLSGYYYALKAGLKINIPLISIIQGSGLSGHIKSEWNRVSTFKEFCIFMLKRLPEAFLCYLPWFKSVARNSNAIAAVSDQAKQGLEREFGIENKRLFVVYNGIDTEIFKPDKQKRERIRKKFSLKDNDKVILMLGIAHKQKGMHIGLRAFVKVAKEVPGAKIMVVGDGIELRSLKILARRLNIDKEVIFAGLIPNEETSFYYNAADVFLNPTLRDEGHPIVMVEAMASGLACVASAIGGTQATIDEGVSGFFVRPKDEETLAKRTIEILSDPELKARLSKNAREKAISKFSKDNMIESYLRISESLR